MVTRDKIRKGLLGAAVLVALVGAGLGARSTQAVGIPAASIPAVGLDVFEVADMLSKAPPDVVVIALDEARRPLLGAVPASAFGESDEALLRSAPKERHIVLVGRDPIRMDRLARRLLATGRHVRVLEGGIDAWDTAMSNDPAAPAPGAHPDLWASYEKKLGLRRYFGDAQAAPAPVVKAAAAPVAAPTTQQKREGC